MKETIKVIIAFIMFCLIGETVYGQKQESSNLVAFEENGRFGYKNESGKIVIEPHFFCAGVFSEGLAPIAIYIEDLLDSRWGYIDENGKMVIEPLFGSADGFSHGLARVQSVDYDEEENHKYGIINKAGTLIVDTIYHNLWIDYGSDWQYEDDSLYDKDIFKVKIDGKIGFVTNNGLVGKRLYNNAEYFYCGKAAVEINGKWGFVDKTGKTIIAPRYDAVKGYLDDGRVYVEIDGEELLIDKIGNVVE